MPDLEKVSTVSMLHLKRHFRGLDIGFIRDMGISSNVRNPSVFKFRVLTKVYIPFDTPFIFVLTQKRNKKVKAYLHIALSMDLKIKFG